MFLQYPNQGLLHHCLLPIKSILTDIFIYLKINYMGFCMKKGYTLIEILVVVFIISILSSITYLSVYSYKNMKNDIELVACENTVLSIIDNGKQYCRENERSGYVIFDVVRNEVAFYCQNRKVDFLKLPKGIKIDSVNINQNRIDIDKFGIAGDAGTIVLLDSNNKYYDITVNVGAGYVEVK